MIFNVKDAIVLHMRWRLFFQFAIERQEPIDPKVMQTILNENCCALGQWILSPAMYWLRERPEYEALARAHVLFHHEMSRVAALINAGRIQEASRALESHSLFELASRALIDVIMEFDRLHPAEAEIPVESSMRC